MIHAYKTTFADFNEAQRLYLKTNRASNIVFLIFLRILPILGALAAVLLFTGTFPSHNGVVVAILSGILAGGAWGMVMALLRPFQLRRLYKQAKNGRSDAEPVEIELSKEQLISRVPGQSEGRFLPAAIHRFVENEKIALIFVAKKRFLYVPKTAMQESDWQVMRDWISGSSEKSTHAD